ncbi:MAG: hypothetical protein ATN33_04370 [Epulopiscium sp. Nele67-Bin001]|nr:MAG: hypothetical protein BEN18_03225 [Epulopiscium sp. Nuni2H_MBin001]OON94491.1 MAG: hypothetical protein ATN33_04370 [Epulopiscium sp. Nele67-Bin001]
MKGVLIYNGFLESTKFKEIHSLYVQEAIGLGLKLECLGTDKIYNNKQFIQQLVRQYDFGLFLDKDILLAKHLEEYGLKLFNCAQVIEICDNKALTQQVLEPYGIKMPKTVVAPLIFENTKYIDNWIESLENYLSYPIVVKESFGSFGEQVYIATDREQLTQLRKKIIYKPHIYQQFISSSFGRDLRINVIGDKVVASMLRTSNDFRANISLGGKMEPFTPENSYIELAIQVAKILKSDFIGVDILFDKEPILCEVNSNAHIISIQQCCGINIAKLILKHIIDKICKISYSNEEDF